MIFLKMNLAVVSVERSYTTVASTQQVRYLVAVMMYLAFECLEIGFIGPMKSTTHFSNACRALTGCIGSSYQHDGLPTR
jgi:hypothetical protein